MVSICYTSSPGTVASGRPAGGGSGQQGINTCGAVSYVQNGLVLVEAGAHGIGHHVTRGRLQGNQDAHPLSNRSSINSQPSIINCSQPGHFPDLVPRLESRVGNGRCETNPQPSAPGLAHEDVENRSGQGDAHL